MSVIGIYRQLTCSASPEKRHGLQFEPEANCLIEARVVFKRVCPLLLFVLLELAALSPTAQSQTLTVLYSFAGYPTDGAAPIAGLLMDAFGNMYGTTRFGGNVNLDYCGGSGYLGCGTVFVLDRNGAETVLHNFDGPGGANPRASLISDAKGNLYGTTE